MSGYGDNVNPSGQFGWQQQPGYGTGPSPPSAGPAPPIDPALQQWGGYYPYRDPPHGEDAAAQPPATSDSARANGKRSLPQAPSPSEPEPSQKKQRKEDVADDFAGERGDKAKPTRGQRACMVCRRLKMKCVGADNPPCKRCVVGNHECIFEESNRGRRPPNQQVKKHELLHRSLRKMERTLDTVLRSISNPGATQSASGTVSRSPSPSIQTAATRALLSSPSPPPVTSFHTLRSSPKLHSLPDNSLNPLGLLAEASLANRKFIKANSQSSPCANGPSKPESAAPLKVGVANDGYFKPGPMTILPLRRLYIERQAQPEMLSFIATEEVVDLFKIYFEHLNPHCCLLLEEFHTPSLVCSRSPFLLTTICAISAKFYPANPDLHSRLNNLAKQLSFSVPEKGYKSVEAYLLLTLWGAGHTENYEQEKTWLLLGMAIRVATDLNLHRKTSFTDNDAPEAAAREREVRNRERTWLLCFILDRSISAQMGKPHCIKEDNIVRNAGLWWRHPTAVPPDSGICAYVELQRVMSRSLDFLYSGTTTISGLQTDCDYLVVTKTIETQLLAWHSDWQQFISQHPSSQDRSVSYRRLIAKFYFNYALLVVNSFGLQNAKERSPVDAGHFFARCHTAASSCAYIVRDELAPQGFLRYSPDSHFVQISYAVLTLLKLVRPEFQMYMENEAKTLGLVRDIANVLTDVAVGPQHTPALYGTFLKALITARGNVSRAASPGTTLQVYTGQSGQTGPGNPGEPTFTLGPQMDQSRDAIDTTQSDFQFIGEMGPAVDISTFPPTMLTPNPHDEDSPDMLSMDSILSANFWDNVLIPGYSQTFEGLSGGMVYGAGGSGLITPRVGSPTPPFPLALESVQIGKHPPRPVDNINADSQ